MNTIRSVGYGWGVLIVAGGGSYYYAKKSVNRDREERALSDQRRRAAQSRLREMELSQPSSSSITHTQHSQASAAKTGPAGTKRKEAHGGGSGNGDTERPSIASKEGGDPAPVTHGQEEMAAKGKYAAAEPYRSRKGDRFS